MSYIPLTHFLMRSNSRAQALTITAENYVVGRGNVKYDRDEQVECLSMLFFANLRCLGSY